MSLEDKITELTAELKKNTAALVASGVKPVGRPPGGGKPAAAAPTATADQVKASAVALKDKHGAPRAKAVIFESSAEADLKGLLAKPEKWDAFVAAAETALAEDDPAGDL